MSPQVKTSYSPLDTFQLGFELGLKLSKGQCILLNGPLGAGKTSLVKGIGASLDIPSSEIQSPTYSLHHSYIGKGLLHHFDLYRLDSTQDFLQRGFMDILESEDPIVIEWPTKVDTSLFNSKEVIRIDIEIVSEDIRELKVSYGQN